MVKTKNEDRDHSLWIWPLAGLILVAGLWTLNWLVAPQTGTAESGTFGDQFGAVNALFSGLAFAGIIYTLVLQRKDLKMQREEMQMQREEMEKSRLEFEEQNFHDVYFNLLKQQRDIMTHSSARFRMLQENEFMHQEIRQESGHMLFSLLRQEARKIYQALTRKPFRLWNEGLRQSMIAKLNEKIQEDKNYSPIEHWFSCQVPYSAKLHGISEQLWNHAQAMTELDRAKLSFAILLASHDFVITSYCRHFNGIIRYLKTRMEAEIALIDPSLGSTEKLSEAEKVRSKHLEYAHFLRDQSSPPELAICFFYSLLVEENLELLIEFRLFDGLFEEDLWGVKPADFATINFRKRNDILEKAVRGSQSSI